VELTNSRFDEVCLVDSIIVSIEGRRPRRTGQPQNSAQARNNFEFVVSTAPPVALVVGLNAIEARTPYR